MAARFPGLETLAGYVSNAWDYEFGSPEAAVESFVADQDEDDVASAATGLAELFTICEGEQDRRLLLRGLGWGYAPGGEGELDEFLIWTRTVLLESAPAG